MGVLAAGLAGGCALDLVGTASLLPGESDAGPTPDAGRSVADAPADAPADTADAAWPTGPATCTCGLSAASGFTLVAYAADRSAGCPSDMTQFDLVTGPTAGPGACACGACAVTATPSCSMGSFASDFDTSTSPACGTRAISHPCNNGACTPVPGTYGQHGRAVPPPPTGPGACTAPGVANQAAAQSAPVRACAESATRCACDPALSPAFHACMRAPGDVACPAQAPNKHLVGAGAAVTCGACGCTLAATCGGSITFYSDTNCTTSLFTITDTACTLEGTGTYSSYLWQGKTSTSCTLGPSAATAGLTAPSTICCP
jgi:hypothetical protein